MRGPKPQTPIIFTVHEVQTLQRLVQVRTCSYGQVIRVQIVLAAHEQPEWSNQRIAQTLRTASLASISPLFSKHVESPPSSDEPELVKDKGGSEEECQCQHREKEGEATDDGEHHREDA